MNIRRRLIATIALAAVALTGCGSVNTAKDEAAQAHAEGLSDVYQAQQMQNEREAHDALHGAKSSPEPTLASNTDPSEAKQQALAADRPEAAWDKHCVAWQLPEPITADRQWVNNLTQTYLDHHDAACPDAIVHPHYYAQSFAPGTTGEIVITLEDAALTEYFVDPNSDGGLQLFGVVIEEVIGQSIVEAIDERVADELGLTDTVWAESDE